MFDLTFTAARIEEVELSATPLLNVKLQITATNPGAPPSAEAPEIHSIMLRCQVRIEPTQRRYNPAEKERLVELFGTPERWGQTVHSMLWMNTSVMVPGFIGTTLVDLPLHCTFDFTIASTKYFHGLADGDVPLSLLFSGTIFYRHHEQGIQVAQIPWEKEAIVRLKVGTWKAMMERHYKGTAWLALQQRAFDQLYEYKRQHGLATWEQTLESLLAAQAEKVAP